MVVATRTTPVEDVTFIIDEVRRLGAAPSGSLSENDAWFSLPHPGGVGSMLCGRAAGRRLEDLAEEAGRRARLSRRVELETLRKILADILVERFFKEKRPVTRQQIDRLLASTAKAARAVCTDLRHFIPCHLMTTKDPEELSLGPVTFRRRAAFRRMVLDQIRSRKTEDEETPAQRRHVRNLLHDAVRYYRNFDWVAEVAIQNCDEDTSYKLAHKAVTSALDCLHLIFGAEDTDQMRVGGPALRHDKRAKLKIDVSGELKASISIKWLGQGTFPDDWSHHLVDPYFARPLALCAIALEVTVDPDLERPLSQRFLDAAQWHGEAARDESPSTRVVKYVTALERMLMTEEKDDISHQVSERVAALCFNPPDVRDRESWRQKARTAYDLRSKLVHGAMSPRSLEVWRGVRLGEELGAALLCALNAFGEEGLRATQMSSRRLSRWFAKVLEWADQQTSSGLPDSTIPSSS